MSDLRVTVEPLADGDGIEVVDPIDRHRYALRTPTPVTPRPADAEPFRYPVETAVTVRTAALALPTVVGVYVRDAEGEVVANLEHLADETFPAGEYSLELLTPIKLYLRVDAPVHVESDMTSTRIEFDGETTVTIGARSRHERPAATVTTTADPEDVMRAVSSFGSALKTTGPERSYPTLRGHPPALELGDELRVPEGLDPPATDLAVEVPRELGAVYAVAPLSYYLGARVRPGERPRVVSEDGALDEPLGPGGTGRGFERAVERRLKAAFFLDCLTRTEGEYGTALHERAAVERETALDFAALYDAPDAERLAAYFDVPFGTLEPHLPEWKLTTHVTPTPDSVETLPFLVDDLAVVRSHDPDVGTTTAAAEQSAAVAEFLRDGTFTRSATESAGGDERYVQPGAADSLEQAWVGEETPLGASKATTTAYRHRLDREPKQGDIGITVVCNDPEMAAEESVVDDAYGDRTDLPFDVRIERGLTTDELRALLGEETDFLHYVGHIEPDGFLCADGTLDARTLGEVGVDAFLLNACSSYDQGMALIDAGAIGGVVTLSDVINSGAVRIGRATARLLNRGFPLRAAMTVARDESIVGSQYIVIGDGGFAITQAESGTPLLYEIERLGGGRFDLELKTYPTSDRGLGTAFTPFIRDNDEYYLTSGTIDSFELSRQELIEFLSLENVPVRLDDALYWSSQLDPSSI